MKTKKLHHIHLIIAAFAAVAASPAAFAVPLTTLATYSEGGAVILSDSDTSPPLDIESTVILPGSVGTSVSDIAGGSGRPGRAAASNDDGSTAVLADGVFWDGGGVDHTLFAKASTHETITNMSGVAQDYFYDFTVASPLLQVADYGGASPGMTGAPTATFGVDVLVNGSSVWFSGATLNGGLGGTVLTETGDFTGLGVYTTPTAGTFVEVDYPTLSATAFLGNFAAGTTFTFEASVSAVASAFGFELGGRASIGDPGIISGGGTITGVPTGTPVPAPATLALLLLPLIGMLAARRRRTI